ncbi:hypothetical protein [Devosia sp.]|uniref:hypothetical protein n=1 Tax=Devosia sp. TaxID=1871048 RepID=UPI002FC89D14
MGGSGDDGFEDSPQRGFAAGEPLAAYESLQRLVLTSYGYRCALTGESFAAATGLLHPRLDVVAIRPRIHGGPLTIANYLPMVGELVEAFEHGTILVEDDYRIVVPNADLLDPAHRIRLRSALHVPAEHLFRPGAAYLAYHRRFVLGR